MWFGQKHHFIDGKWVHGRWHTYDSRQAAIAAGNHFVSILALGMTVDEYDHWCRMHEKAGNQPGRQRLTVPFRGPFFADFDRDGQVGRLKSALVRALHQLVADYRLHPDALQIWYSGSKGFHLEIPAMVFGAQNFAHTRLPSIYAKFGEALGLGSLLDPAVYSESRGRLWRVANRRRENGRHKIPLRLEELETLDMRQIKRLSKAPRQIDPPTRRALHKNRRLVKCFEECRKTVLAAPRYDRSTSGPSSKEITEPPPSPSDFDPAELDAVVDALNNLPDHIVDDYMSWLRIGMALHHGCGGSDSGLQLWSAWSRRSAKYDPLVLERKWDSFATNRTDRITLATLFGLAAPYA